MVHKDSQQVHASSHLFSTENLRTYTITSLIANGASGCLCDFLEVADVLEPRQVKAVGAEARESADSAGEAEHGEAERVDSGRQRRPITADEGCGVARMQIAKRLGGSRRRRGEGRGVVDASSAADLTLGDEARCAALPSAPYGRRHVRQLGHVAKRSGVPVRRSGVRLRMAGRRCRRRLACLVPCGRGLGSSSSSSRSLSRGAARRRAPSPG